MKFASTFALFGMLGAAAAAAQAPQSTGVPQPGAQPSQQAPSGQSESLGRLFFTPSERARLDDLRHRPPPPPVEIAKPEQPLPAPGPRYVTVNGVVRRSDGESTVWLNNKPVRGQQAEQGLLVAPTRGQPPSHVTVRVPETGRSVDVKVGQQLEVNSGSVQETYRQAREPEPLAQPSRLKTEEVPARPSERRAGRERELLRDLLREIEAESAASKPAATAPEPGIRP
jgi:hypothetical protein